MTATLAAQAPRFHSLTGTQPVGHTQIATQAEHVGATTLVRRVNHSYWAVITADTRDLFRSTAPRVRATAHIWFDRNEQRYVVDYQGQHMVAVEVDRTRGLQAAIGSAVANTAERWAAAREEA
jgi:hypothetical protein